MQYVEIKFNKDTGKCFAKFDNKTIYSYDMQSLDDAIRTNGFVPFVNILTISEYLEGAILWPI